LNKILKFINLFVILTLLFGLLVTSDRIILGETRSQPVLLQMAAQDPDQVVSVIVQKTSDGRGLENLVVGLGGRVLDDLSIIHAFSAELSAAAVLELARHPGVRWVSLDAPMQETGCPADCVDTTYLQSAYVRAIQADKVWNQSPFRQGQGIGVAVVDSGINWQTDLYSPSGQNRVVANVRFNTDYNQTTFDNYGHGSHVAGVVGGNGRTLNGTYIGVAPKSNIINVKVSNDDGSSTASKVVAGLEWVLNNRTTYNIRVVNLSLNSVVAESYHTSPLAAAVEVLWFNGIVVVVSAGNNGTANIYPPANDPFVITVGAADDRGTPALNDDLMPSFSAYGTTVDGFVKPDLVAPGKNIISLRGNSNGVLPTAHPGNRVGNDYFKMSGTSVASPIVAGAVALLLQDEPNLNPDQVKYRLMSTASKQWPGYNTTTAGAGYLNVYAAVNGTTSATANTGIAASQLLWTGSTPITWGSVAWNSVAWNSVAWNSVAWNSVAWNSVAWNSDYWGQ
jgi:serine protease AprX